MTREQVPNCELIQCPARRTRGRSVGPPADHVWAVELECTAMARYAVCDCKHHNGAVWLKRDKIVHVYACPLKFAPQPSADDTAAVPADDPAAALPADNDADASQSAAASQYLYIRDCDGMSRVGEKLAHLGDVSSMTCSECIDELGGEGAFCQHSVALATLIAERRVPDPGCSGRLPYDGQPDAVFNLSNHSLFADETTFIKISSAKRFMPRKT
ncbi:hypothetical protein FOA52_014166 [Chlamydomonas sp. UWO 241]|nr:hypothetical protein FOA52_014166 [Chlamydomonas sp. UWO 241]